MTQASHAKPSPSLGAAAAAAATTNGPAATVKPDDKTAAEKTAAEKAAAEKEAEKAAKKARARKIFIVVGDIHEFETPAKAEKFLNTEGAPQAYAVIRGNRINRSTKVSLR
jgi:hypothetical protein